jgi:hypothetical protein
MTIKRESESENSAKYQRRHTWKKCKVPLAAIDIDRAFFYMHTSSSTASDRGDHDDDDGMTRMKNEKKKAPL